MSYISVIPLADAKQYLRIDDTVSDDEITRMIGSALKYLEDRTNVLVFSRTKTYYYLNSRVNVYDGPITAVTPTDGFDRKDYPIYSTFISTDGSQTIELTVGHVNPTDVPTDIIEAAYEMLDYWFYKNDGTVSMTLIPESVQAVIDVNKRFVL